MFCGMHLEHQGYLYIIQCNYSFACNGVIFLTHTCIKNFRLYAPESVYSLLKKNTCVTSYSITSIKITQVCKANATFNTELLRIYLNTTERNKHKSHT